MPPLLPPPCTPHHVPPPGPPTAACREGELDEREVDVEVPPSSPRVMGPFGGSEAADLQVRRLVDGRRLDDVQMVTLQHCVCSLPHVGLPAPYCLCLCCCFAILLVPADAVPADQAIRATLLPPRAAGDGDPRGQDLWGAQQGEAQDEGGGVPVPAEGAGQQQQ